MLEEKNDIDANKVTNTENLFEQVYIALNMEKYILCFITSKTVQSYNYSYYT